MVVWDGGFEGTIGGGHLELEALKEARSLLSAAEGSGLESPVIRDIALGPSLGQCCGGRTTLVFEAIRPTRWHVAVYFFLVNELPAGLGLDRKLRKDLFELLAADKERAGRWRREAHRLVLEGDVPVVLPIDAVVKRSRSGSRRSCEAAAASCHALTF
jgi:xanthine/CO dehydrogenase XdhC/CoxF family maturation factor